MNHFWRRGVALVWGILVLLGLWRLELDVQVLNLLPAEVPSVRALKLYEEHFANANELVISLHGLEPAALEEAARDLAGELRRRTNLVSEAVWTPPWLEHPGQMAEFSAYLWLNQPPREVELLTARLAAANLPALLAETRQRLTISLSPEEIARLSYDPFGLLQLPGQESGTPGFGDGAELFASASGDFRILFVDAREHLGDYRENQVWLEQLKTVVAAWRQSSPEYDSLVTGFTGRPAFVSEISGTMEWDIATSAGGTLIIIAILFWVVHRRWKPLLWLVALLGVILLSTLAAGGLIFRSLNVISLGFAAILLGLSVDYGLVLYQEWLSSRETSTAALRRAVTPSVVWAAVSTAGAFAVLNLGGLPGLAQLGTLVAVGVAISASVMLGFYLAPFKRKIHGPRTAASRSRTHTVLQRGFNLISGVIVLAGTLVLIFSPPRLDVSSAALRPADSPAYAAVKEIKLRMDRPEEPLWVVGTGTSFDDLARRFESALRVLEMAETSGRIASATIPVELIPRPEFQRENIPLLTRLAARQNEFAEAATQAGFTEDSLRLLKTMFVTWRAASEGPLPYLPQAQAGHWIMERFLSLDPKTFFALGMVHPSPETERAQVRETLTGELAEAGVVLTGWELLGSEVFEVVKRKFVLIFGLMTVMVLTCLTFAFKRLIPVLLSVASVLVSALALLSLMWLAGWEWNLMNLMAIPLLIGAGLDYSIHVQLALDRHHGNIAEMRGSVGRALFLCAATTCTGFGSLAWAGNPGLGSLGLLCASGIASAYLVAVWLLPAWRAVVLKRPLEITLEK